MIWYFKNVMGKRFYGSRWSKKILICSYIAAVSLALLKTSNETFAVIVKPVKLFSAKPCHMC